MVPQSPNKYQHFEHIKPVKNRGQTPIYGMLSYPESHKIDILEKGQPSASK